MFESQQALAVARYVGDNKTMQQKADYAIDTAKEELAKIAVISAS